MSKYSKIESRTFSTMRRLVVRSLARPAELKAANAAEMPSAFLSTSLRELETSSEDDDCFFILNERTRETE